MRLTAHWQNMHRIARRATMRIPSVSIRAVVVSVLAPMWSAAAQQRTLRIAIRDSLTSAPLVGVAVAPDSGAGPLAISDSAGQARGSVGAAQQRVFLTRMGYAPRWLDLPAGDALSIDVAMARSTSTLEGVAIEARAVPDVPMRLREFEERRQAGRAGIFFTRQDIVRRNTNRLTDLFRGYPSLKVVDSAGVKAVASARSVMPTLNKANGPLRYCLLRVVIDGQPKETGFPLDAIEPSEVHGIEVYSGPSTVPAQYGSFGRDAFCGVILLWTR